MTEYIKRTDVMKICEEYSEHCFNSSDAKGQDIADRIFDDVVEIPTADVVEVKHGKWIRREPNPERMRDFHKQGIGVVMAENSIYWTCSICGDWGVPHNKYCRECGAKMDGTSQKEWRGV